MTNADKYLKDGVDVDKFAEELVYYIDKISSEPTDICPFHIKNFLKYEVKPILTEDEKVILRNIDDTKHNDLVIKRCKNENLIIYNGGNWAWQIDIFNHLFQFIQPRRRI